MTIVPFMTIVPIMTIVPVMTIVPIIKTMTIFIILVVRFITGHYEYREECRQVLNLFLSSLQIVLDLRLRHHHRLC